MRHSHTLPFAYILCALLGYLGVHRFYYDSKKMGFLYLFTFGIFGIGWLYDLFTLPKLHAEFMKQQPTQGSANYTLAWILLLLFGILGLHKIYLQKPFMFFMYFMTFGFLGFGVIIDMARLNKQVEIFNINEAK